MRTRWMLFFLLILPVWKLWQRLPYLSQLSAQFGSWFLVSLVTFRMAQFLWSKVFMKLVDGDGKAVLVTGCDTGFGNLLAKRLSREGFFVYAGCLNVCCDGAHDLSRDVNIRVLQMDVTKDEDMKNALISVEGTLGSKVLWAVVANAGVPSHGLLEWESMRSIRKVFDVNVFGAVSVSKTFLPLLRKSRGRLVLVASVLGRGTVPAGVSYCMSKHAVISLADGLRRECLDKGVDVVTIEPTAYKTRIVAEVGSVMKVKEDLDLLPREVLDDYTEQDILNWLKTAESLVKWMSRENINEVVDQMVLAVRESETKPYYSAWGPLDPIFYFVLRQAPAEVIDSLTLVVRKICEWRK